MMHFDKKIPENLRKESRDIMSTKFMWSSDDVTFNSLDEAKNRWDVALGFITCETLCNHE